MASDLAKNESETKKMREEIQRLDRNLEYNESRNKQFRIECEKEQHARNKRLRKLQEVCADTQISTVLSLA